MSIEREQSREQRFCDQGPLREGSAAYSERCKYAEKDDPESFGYSLLKERQRLREAVAQAKEDVQRYRTAAENARATMSPTQTRQHERALEGAEEWTISMDAELQAMTEGRSIEYENAFARFIEQRIDSPDAATLREKHSPELFFEFVERHQREFEKQREEFEREKEKIVKDFLASVEEAVDAGWLPVDMARVRRRVNETMIALTDTLGSPTISGHSGIWRISIANSVPKEEWRHTIFHELVHQAVAGRELHLGIYRGAIKKVLFRRSGLRVKEYDPDGNEIAVRYSAINEAVTEKIALRLLKDPKEEIGAYSYERAQLDVAVADEDMESHMMVAYCEDEDPDVSEENRNAQWRSFTASRQWDEVIREL